MTIEPAPVISRDRKPLFSLLVANSISMTGNVMTLTVIPWFVLQTTGSATRTGVAAFFNVLPIVVANLLGGALIDRLGFRTVSIVSDVASGVTLALIPLLHVAGLLEFWVLLALVFLGALLDAPGTTARSALMPEAAGAAGWSLERATGVAGAVERGSRLAGAPIAGLLIALIGATNVLWVDAATFALSALIVALGTGRVERPARVPGRRYLQELKEGIAFLRNDRLLLAMILTVTVTNLLDSASTVLLPVYANDIYGSPVVLGLMIGALGGGSVIGALAFAAGGRRASRRKVFALCFMVVAARYPILALFPPPAFAIGAMAIAGLAAGPLNPLINTIEYERVPPAMRGRVFGVGMSAAWMAMPVGVLATGVVVDLLGLRTTLLVTGALYLVATASIWLNPSMRAMDAPGVPARREDDAAPADKES